MDADTIQTIKDVGSAVAFAAFAGYSQWRHVKTDQHVAATEEKVNTSYAMLEADFDSMHASMERLSVKIYGERRATPRAPKTGEQRWRGLINNGEPEPA